MKYRYEFEMDDDSFEKGQCHGCPCSYDEEYPDGYETLCVFGRSYWECPLEEIED